MITILKRGDIVYNVDNKTDLATAIQRGAVPLSGEEISAAGMSGYENIVSPVNTSVSPDGAITFIPPVMPSQGSLFVLLRAERNRRLAATDYMLMPDYPIDDTLKENIQAYRQALRDLPSQEGAPWDGGGEETPWPEIPSVLQEQQGSSTSSVYTPGVV